MPYHIAMSSDGNTSYVNNAMDTVNDSEINTEAAAPMPAKAHDTTAENPWSVSRVSEAFSSAVDRWPALWVDGQIAEITVRRANSAYITLRDNVADISLSVVGFGVFAATAQQFSQGDRVVIHGSANIWQKATRLSLRGDIIQRVGKGDLRAQLERLRQKLKGEGLFDADKKIPLPEFPKLIGLVCGPQARAEGDIKTNAALRWPTIKFRTAYARVQGAECPEEVVKAIQKLDADPEVDVIIVARGGGSFEDLMGFSDESVVRAAAACKTPLVSAIGHEDDWSLLDLVADMRASTPTDAAKRVVPDVLEQLSIIDQQQKSMNDYLRSRLTYQLQLIEGYANRPSLTNPLTMLEMPEQLLLQSRKSMNISMHQYLDEKEAHIDKLNTALTALSPQSTLDRGYAIVQNKSGKIVENTDTLTIGEDIHLVFRHGWAEATVNKVEGNKVEDE